MSICLYTQIYFQKTAPYIILKLLHVSATNRSLLQESTVLENIDSLLCKFPVVNGELYTLLHRRTLFKVEMLRNTLHVSSYTL